MFGFLRKKKSLPSRPRKASRSGTTDLKKILAEISTSRDKIIQEIHRIPDSQQMTSLLAEQITSPLKEFIAETLSRTHAVKQETENRLSGNQAVKQEKTLDEVVTEMKNRLEMLSQRHLKVIGILAQNKDEWLGYEDIGSFCSPPLTGSCIRGYVADLVNVYKIPIEKKNFGRQSRVRIAEDGWKQMAVTKILAKQ